jgi:hypothetical protein
MSRGNQVTVAGLFTYVTGSHLVQMVDIAIPYQPHAIGGVPRDGVGGWGIELASTGNLAAITLGENGLGALQLDACPSRRGRPRHPDERYQGRVPQSEQISV